MFFNLLIPVVMLGATAFADDTTLISTTEPVSLQGRRVLLLVQDARNPAGKAGPWGDTQKMTGLLRQKAAKALEKNGATALYPDDETVHDILRMKPTERPESIFRYTAAEMVWVLRLDRIDYRAVPVGPDSDPVSKTVLRVAVRLTGQFLSRPGRTIASGRADAISGPIRSHLSWPVDKWPSWDAGMLELTAGPVETALGAAVYRYIHAVMKPDHIMLKNANVKWDVLGSWSPDSMSRQTYEGFFRAEKISITSLALIMTGSARNDSGAVLTAAAMTGLFHDLKMRNMANTGALIGLGTGAAAGHMLFKDNDIPAFLLALGLANYGRSAGGRLLLEGYINPVTVSGTYRGQADMHFYIPDERKNVERARALRKLRNTSRQERFDMQLRFMVSGLMAGTAAGIMLDEIFPSSNHNYAGPAGAAAGYIAGSARYERTAGKGSASTSFLVLPNAVAFAWNSSW